MAKTDMERVGVFSEMGYTTIGDPYVPPSGKAFNASAGKGKQMMIGGTKSKTAGYFGKTFDRIMEGESYSDAVKQRRQDRLKEAKRNIGKAFVPTSGSKLPSGQGSHYGTLGGPTTAFSAAMRSRDKYKAPGRNFLTNPGKRGTGYGYVGVTIGSRHKYSSEPYSRAQELRKREHDDSKKKVKGGPFKLNNHPNDFFDGNPYRSDRALPPIREPKTSKDKLKPFKPSHPAKLVGGCKAGTFESYPKHSVDPYGTTKVRKDAGSEKSRGIFRPSLGPKSTPTSSIVQQSVMRRMNVSNYLSAAAMT